jgi:hypothetical protein
MAESLEAMGRSVEAKPHFQTAYELLSQDAYCQEYEKPLLERLKTMVGK